MVNFLEVFLLSLCNQAQSLIQHLAGPNVGKIVMGNLHLSICVQYLEDPVLQIIEMLLYSICKCLHNQISWPFILMRKFILNICIKQYSEIWCSMYLSVIQSGVSKFVAIDTRSCVVLSGGW